MATPCEQAALDLAAARAAFQGLLTGGRVTDIRHGDKGVSYYGAGNIADLRSWIRELQAKVDACNGLRSRGRFIRNVASDE